MTEQKPIPFFNELDRSAWTIARDVMGDELDQRALEYIRENPSSVKSLLLMRQLGKCDLPLDMVQQFCALGIMSADEDGYYLSDVVENLLDEMIKRLADSTGSQDEG